MGTGKEFIDFFTNLYAIAPESFIPIFLLGLFRLAPIVALAPFLGAKLPVMLKIGTLLSLLLILYPHLVMTSQTVLEYNTLFFGYAIKEVFIGFIIAFLVIIPFYFVQSAGVLIDFLRGASSLQVSDPFSQSQTSPIGNLYNYVLIAMFYIIGGFFIFLDTLYMSYRIIPMDTFINPLFFAPEQPFWGVITAIATKVISLAIQLAAPALMAILMTEVFLGIANRLAPQVQIAFLGMSVKSLLGLTLLCAGWIFILKQVDKQTFLWLKEIDKVLFYIPPLK
jgi:type III secretion protein T